MNFTLAEKRQCQDNKHILVTFHTTERRKDHSRQTQSYFCGGIMKSKTSRKRMAEVPEKLEGEKKVIQAKKQMCYGFI